MANTKIYQFKIELLNINPSIWRRIQLQSSASFWKFHCAIQNSMGWKDCHLHRFELKNPLDGTLVRIETETQEEAAQEYAHQLQVLANCRAMGIPMRSDPDEGKIKFDSWKAPISKYYSPGPPHYATDYTYDFGDNWIHRISFEGSFEPESGKSYPACVDGQRACPPEDCGGPTGFEELKIALTKRPDQRTQEEKEKIEWLSNHMRQPNYDPDFFYPSIVVFMDPANWGK